LKKGGGGNPKPGEDNSGGMGDGGDEDANGDDGESPRGSNKLPRPDGTGCACAQTQIRNGVVLVMTSSCVFTALMLCLVFVVVAILADSGGIAKAERVLYIFISIIANMSFFSSDESERWIVGLDRNFYTNSPGQTIQQLRRKDSSSFTLKLTLNLDS